MVVLLRIFHKLKRTQKYTFCENNNETFRSLINIPSITKITQLVIANRGGKMGRTSRIDLFDPPFFMDRAEVFDSVF
jgi:hypothetical protein